MGKAFNSQVNQLYGAGIAVGAGITHTHGQMAGKTKKYGGSARSIAYNSRGNLLYGGVRGSERFAARDVKGGTLMSDQYWGGSIPGNVVYGYRPGFVIAGDLNRWGQFFDDTDFSDKVVGGWRKGHEMTPAKRTRIVNDITVDVMRGGAFDSSEAQKINDAVRAYVDLIDTRVSQRGEKGAQAAATDNYYGALYAFSDGRRRGAAKRWIEKATKEYFAMTPDRVSTVIEKRSEYEKNGIPFSLLLPITAKSRSWKNWQPTAKPARRRTIKKTIVNEGDDIVYPGYDNDVMNDEVLDYADIGLAEDD